MSSNAAIENASGDWLSQVEGSASPLPPPPPLAPPPVDDVAIDAIDAGRAAGVSIDLGVSATDAAADNVDIDVVGGRAAGVSIDLGTIATDSAHENKRPTFVQADSSSSLASNEIVAPFDENQSL